MIAQALPLAGVQPMSHADYLGVPAVSNSGMKALRRSPWHYRATSDPSQPHPQRAPSPAMFAGTLMHTALLEPASFDERFSVGPEVSRNSRAWREYVQALAPGAQAITQLQRDTAHAQAASLAAEPYVADLFAREGANEVSFFWTDEETGLLCKARADRAVSTPSGAILFDAKTAADASRAGFTRSVGTFFYDMQAAWYARGWRIACGQAVHGMVFGVVESEFPYAAAAYMLSDADVMAADAECTRLLRVLAQCESAGHWPGYPSGMNAPLSLPAWVARVRAEATAE